ncbi:hypothetical protein AVEN_82438-1 [Araneus ventricosus]|uniref:Uncharacterized protein n=1 Tax=Araneus ventricosus TaxID=182803 RepID=A0A4Y2GWQ4_ARAVE|nr:hypothetical protein AVEN_82438-1 [Araneus ventricosus]
MTRLSADFYYNQIITGHGIFGAFQNRMFGKDCKCQCGEDETIKHVLMECPVWAQQRDKLPKSWFHCVIALASEEVGDASVEQIPLPPSADLCYRAGRGRFVLPHQEFRMASAETGTLTAYMVNSELWRTSGLVR